MKLFIALLFLSLQCFSQSKKITLQRSTGGTASGKIGIPIRVGSGVTIIKVSNSTATPPPGSNQFVVQTGGQRTSAAVYNTSGIMVRTLWSGINLSSGTYTIKWDGTDDAGNTLPVQDYNIKVLTNNVTYTYQGTVANSSTSQTDKYAFFRSLEPPMSIVANGSKLYYSVGYNESGNAVSFAFDTTNIQTSLNYWQGYSNMVSSFVATDGNYNYWHGFDSYDQAHSWVYATKVSDNSEITNFTSGTGSYKVLYGRTFASTILHKNVAGTDITGLAVTNNFVYAARKNNTLDVANKTTGASLSSMSFNNVKAIGYDNTNNILWICHDVNVVENYSINNTTGALTSLGRQIILNNPSDIKVFNGNVVIVDAGINSNSASGTNQIKAYNTSTGALQWTLGQSGGNLTNPVVANDRFAFWFVDENTSLKEAMGSIAFEQDGSMWVTDPGNHRIMHYSSNREYISQILYQGKTYSCYVDPNNHSRMITNFQEFSVNYNQPDIHKAWTYSYNWEGRLRTNDNWQGGVRNITTLSNGRTYGLLFQRNGTVNGGKNEVMELDPAYGLRPTGVITSLDGPKMYPDGTIYGVNAFGLTEKVNWRKQTITGFDGSNNPIYSGITQVLQAADFSNDYTPRLSGAKMNPWEITSSGVLASFRGNIDYDAGGQSKEPEGAYHLGGMNPLTGQFLWKTSLATRKDYAGEFPYDGGFDVGNGPSQYAGNVAVAIDRNIFWGYNGEFWKQSQTNIWNHYYDNGLFVGQFGKTGPQYDLDNIANQEFAGNAFSPAFVKEGSDYYMYVNDESVHGGILRFKITNLSSIAVQDVPISSSYVRTTESFVPNGTTDLMAVLPFTSSPPANNIGRTSYSPVGNANFTVTTGSISYLKRFQRDVYIQYNSGAGIAYFNFDLGTNTSGAWSINGIYKREGVTVGTGTGFAQLQVLDGSGKIIASLDYMTPDYGATGFHVKANGQDVTPVGSTYQDQPNPAGVLANNLNNLKITAASSSSITFNYGTYTLIVPIQDNTANWQNPKTLRMYFTGGGQKMQMQNFIFTPIQVP